MKLLVGSFASEKRAQGWLSPLFICVLAIAIYSINLVYVPVTDELYHLLAARGFLEYGEPRIAEGVYTRTTLFTAMIAVLFDLIGESIVAVRLPAVLAGGVMMACIFAWTRRVAGSGTAWIVTFYSHHLPSRFAGTVGFMLFKGFWSGLVPSRLTQ
jgi:4-amino-4-deoxy-L-arabinose transferase-like glycosyltransferase